MGTFLLSKGKFFFLHLSRMPYRLSSSAASTSASTFTHNSIIGSHHGQYLEQSRNHTWRQGPSLFQQYPLEEATHHMSHKLNTRQHKLHPSTRRSHGALTILIPCAVVPIIYQHGHGHEPGGRIIVLQRRSQRCLGGNDRIANQIVQFLAAKALILRMDDRSCILAAMATLFCATATALYG